MDEKFNVLEGDVEYVVPTAWHEGHVAHRLVKAYEVLTSMPASIGPRFVSSAWPAALTEFSDLASEEAWKRHLTEAFAGGTQRWTAEEIGLADEALAWPLRYMPDMPLRTDAMQLWAFARATNRSLDRLLRTRARQAARAAAAATMAENARRTRLRGAVAQDVVAWANEQLRHERDPERVSHIRNLAHLRMSDLCLGLQPVNLRPSDVLRDRVLHRTALYRHLPVGLETLAARLHKAGVPVR